MRTIIPMVQFVTTSLLLVIGDYVNAVSVPHASVNGSPCDENTLQDALNSASNGDTIYLQAGYEFDEGGFIISKNVTIKTGNSSCGSPSGSVAQANIDGNAGALGPLTISAGHTVTFENVIVADHTGTNGGNLHIDGSVMLIDAIVRSGQATEGGGIFVDEGGVVELYGTTQVALNNADVDGGGVKVLEGGRLEMYDNTKVWANSAGRDGGGIDSWGTVVLRDHAVVSTNAAENYGGGLSVISQYEGVLDAICSRCTIGNNTAVGGGGLHAYGYPTTATVDLTNVTLDHNSASVGGGIYIYGASQGVEVSLWFVEVTNNDADAGGGLFLNNGDAGVIYIDNSLINYNSATNEGGGISAIGSSDTYVYSTEITGNTASKGGGLAMIAGGYNGPIFLTGTWVHENEARGDGGGLYMAGDTSLDLKNTWTNNNTAHLGGGILMDTYYGFGSPILNMDGPADIEGCTESPVTFPQADQYCSEVRENSATLGGGGIMIRQGTATISRTAFIANTAPDGLAIRLTGNDNASLTLKNTLIAQHRGNLDQKVVWAGNDTTLVARFITVTDSLLAIPVQYDATAQGKFVRSIVWDINNFVVVAPNSITATCTSFTGVTGKTTGARQAMFTDPLFMTTSRGAYRLSMYSPEIDQCPQGPNYDLDSDSRPVGIGATPYDRGAFEFQ